MLMWLLIPLILIHAVLAFVAAPPNAVARKFFKKFEAHQPLSIDPVTITFGEKQLEGEEKKQVINSFNQAVFGYRYYKLPGASGTPFVMDTKEGKHVVRIFLYCYDNRVDVFKEYKKKVVAYRLVSESLQKLFNSPESPLIPV